MTDLLKLLLIQCNLSQHVKLETLIQECTGGKNFLTLNVDNGDQPLNIDLNPGKYNADQLAAEVQSAINAAYGDDKKVQIVQNVDDTVNIQFYKLQADGSSSRS